MIDMKTYSELISYETFEERLEYLMTNSKVGFETFGHARYLNQRLYTSFEWRKLRDEIILRDSGFDLGHPDVPIFGPIRVHHINPLQKQDILDSKSWIFDPEYLISCSLNTHNIIHYGYEIPERTFNERYSKDQILW